jgi:hypothetical protein
MSNNPWSMPEPGGQLPPPAPPTSASAEPPATEPVWTTKINGPPPRRRTARVVAAAAAVVVGLLGVGVVLYLMFGRDDGTTTGARSPEEAVTGLAAAVSADDSLGALQFVAPDEIDGVSELLQVAIDQAKTEGVDVGVGGNADLTVTVSGVRTTRLADHAARVSFDVDGGAAITARLAEIVGDGDSVSSTEVSVIAVQLDGGWFLSPLLTVGEHLVDAYDLPGGDFQRIGEKSTTVKASSPEEAVNTLLDGLADLDADRAAGVLSSGEARAVRVFGDALGELTDAADDAMADNGVDAKLDDVQLTDLGAGRIGIDGLTVDWTSRVDHITVEVDHDCLVVRADGDRNRACALNNAPFTAPLTDQQVVLRAEKQDGGYRVGLVRSAAEMGTAILQAVDHDALSRLLGAPQLGTPQPLTFATVQPVTFVGEPSQMFEVQLPAGQSFSVDARSADDDVYLYTALYVQRDGRWEHIYDGEPPLTEPAVGRLVVVADCEDWDDSALFFRCSSWAQGEATVSVS